MIFRVFLSLVVLTFGGFSLVDNTNTLVQGRVLGWQLNPSDTDYLMTHAVSSFATQVAEFFHTFGFLIALAALLAIWWGPISRAIGHGLSIITAVSIGLLSMAPHPTWAYYADSDYAEAFMILPNESAFWIPDVGDNKNTQAQFGSADYYRDHKIAAKRFDVTNHVKLANSGLWANKYVSPGRLIKVDRTPVTREWVMSDKKGTGEGKDEGFPCQSMEGLDVGTGVSIGTYVTEEDAPTFLYHFGVNTPKGDPNDPQVIFTSVYYGKSLAQVMDERIRHKVQSMVCDEMTAHPLTEDNHDAKKIMAEIEKVVKPYLKDYGITLDFIGWADTFHFDPKVQDAINRRFVADIDKSIADDMASRTDTLTKLASSEAIRTTSNKWDGHLPGQVSLSLWGGLQDLVGKWFGGGK